MREKYVKIKEQKLKGQKTKKHKSIKKGDNQNESK